VTASPHAFYRAKEAFRAARPLSSVWHCQAHFSRISRRPRYQQLATAGSPPQPAARLPRTSRRPKLCAHNMAQRPQPQAAHPTPPHSTPSPAAEPHDLAPPARDVRRHRWHVQSLCRRDRCQLHQAAPARKAGARLCHDERVEGALSVLLGALEPALVANLHLEQVQVAVADRRVDQLVAAALVAVRCARSTLSLLSTVSAQATLAWLAAFYPTQERPLCLPLHGQAPPARSRMLCSTQHGNSACYLSQRASTAHAPMQRPRPMCSHSNTLSVLHRRVSPFR